jgi:predicted DNA-binding ribbon-helix-helix protein
MTGSCSGTGEVRLGSNFIDGRKISVSLKDEFWDGLNKSAVARNMKLHTLVTKIDSKRGKDDGNGTASPAITLLVCREMVRCGSMRGVCCCGHSAPGGAVFGRKGVANISGQRELPHVGAAKSMRASISPSSTRCRGVANARRDCGNRHRGRDRPDLVGRCDVQVGPLGRLGNEVGRDIY